MGHIIGIIALIYVCSIMWERPSTEIAKNFDKRQPQKIAVIPFDSMVLVQDFIPKIAAEITADRLEQKGYKVVPVERIMWHMKELGMSDPGQIHCCIEQLRRKTKADAFLIGRIISYGRVYSSISGLVFNIKATFTYSPSPGESQQRLVRVPVVVEMDLVDPDKPRIPLWHNQSREWMGELQRATPITNTEQVFFNLFWAVNDALGSLPDRWVLAQASY
jgi:hypothetical protein